MLIYYVIMSFTISNKPIDLNFNKGKFKILISSNNKVNRDFEELLSYFKKAHNKYVRRNNIRKRSHMIENINKKIMILIRIKIFRHQITWGLSPFLSYLDIGLQF